MTGHVYSVEMCGLTQLQRKWMPRADIRFNEHNIFNDRKQKQPLAQETSNAWQIKRAQGQMMARVCQGGNEDLKVFPESSKDQQGNNYSPEYFSS